MPSLSRRICLAGVKNVDMTMNILSANLRALMAAHVTLTTQAAVGRACGIDQRTVGRIINMEHSPGVQQLEAIAAAFDLLTWQLLVPNLDPKNPPVCEFNKVERDLYKKLRTLVKQLPDA